MTTGVSFAQVGNVPVFVNESECTVFSFYFEGYNYVKVPDTILAGKLYLKIEENQLFFIIPQTAKEDGLFIQGPTTNFFLENKTLTLESNQIKGFNVPAKLIIILKLTDSDTKRFEVFQKKIPRE